MKKTTQNVKYYNWKSMKKLDNMQGQPLISVIVPVYNAENTLHVAIDSLINQSYKSIELIVVNDCSKDNTHNVLLQYKAKLAASIGISMKIINHESNKGLQLLGILG